MGRLSLRLGVALLLGGALVANTAGRASAESALWTLIASPLAVTAGVQTDFTLTATNEDPLAALLSSSEIGCVEVTVPVTYTVSGAAVSASSAGESWTTGVAGNLVRVRAGSGGDRLSTLDWVRLTVRATAWSAGSLAWASRAYRQTDCSGTGTLLNLPPIVVVTEPLPTPLPTPLPSLIPTPLPTPLPSLIPLPTPTLLPTPAPTSTPTSSARPSSPATPVPGGSADATPRGVTPSPDASPAAGTERGTSASPGPAGDASPGGTGLAGTGGAGVELRVSRLDGDARAVRVDTGLLGLDSDYSWLVPAAAIGVPGLVIIAWVALQTAAVLAWIPAVRRLREEKARGEPQSVG